MARHRGAGGEPDPLDHAPLPSTRCSSIPRRSPSRVVSRGDRRAERAVIAEYERLIDEAVGVLPYDTLLSLAESVLSIKGYGPVKEAAVAAWRTRVAELLGRVPVAAGNDA